jgi:uncharacterized protein YuzE
MSKFKALYDGEANSLSVYNEERKASASIRLGEIIVSLDSNYHVSAIEILNPDLLYKIDKPKLSRISSAAIQTQQRGAVLWIYVILSFSGSERPETLPVQLQLERPVCA